MKLSKKQKKIVKKVKEDISFLQGQQEEIYQLCCLELNTKDESGWLFDYCYNQTKLSSLDNL